MEVSKTFSEASFNSNLPNPIAFNTWKHHLGYIVTNINQFIQNNENPENIKTFISGIGGTLLDIYTGALSENSIASEIVAILKAENSLSINNFKRWLNFPNCEYKSIILSDSSRWVLKLGIFPNRFVHIHPGRYSPYTIRCRPSNLKTAIMYKSVFGTNNVVTLERYNSIRKIIGLSPQNRKFGMDGFLKTFRAISVKEV